MIITRLVGGLGNQLFQYALGRHLSLKLQVPLKLDAGFFKTQALRELELHKLNIDTPMVSEKELRLLAGRQDRFFSKLASLGIYNRPSTCFQEKEITIFDSNILQIQKGYLDGFWQNESYFRSIRAQLLKDIQMREPIGAKAGEMLSHIREVCSVSIHVRRGDYVNNINAMKAHGICEPTYYRNAVARISQEYPDASFFVFSDDQDWCKKNLQLNVPLEFVDMAASAEEDLTLMKHCQHNIVANSSFSWWGGWLNQNPEKIVVAPEAWFARSDWSHYHPAPPEWIRI
jgi:hypothetical protein